MTALERSSTASEPRSAMASTANARRLLVPRPCNWAQLQPLSSALEHRPRRRTGHRSVSRLRMPSLQCIRTPTAQSSHSYNFGINV